MNGKNFITGLLVLLTLPLVNCGGGGGGGGNTNPGNTGVDITGVNITGTTALIANSGSNDTVALNFTATRNIQGNAFPVTVDQCVVSYTPLNAGPAIPNLTLPSPCVINAEGAGTCEPFTIITRLMKENFWNIGAGKGEYVIPNYPVQYTATVNCDFSNLNANNGAFATSTPIGLTIDTSKMIVDPETTDTTPIIINSVNGTATFTIDWGLPPYTLLWSGATGTVDTTQVVVWNAVALTHSFAVNATSSGTGDVTVTVRDNSSPKVTRDVFVTVGP